MSEARRNLDWNRMFELAIDREKRKDTAKARCLKMKTPVPCAAECAQSKTQTKP